ncbi:hypothetical protein AJ79_09736 [Helicocarpus griseus UAMH5409]|uniref:Zn(2)-C6 fungal-type domain-containing protein n=1 Tax=Helicocarpus griseus UAMH5409 TaxID=1447875 RepID=A0A2B7WHM5_9EURO|nr:hypothetical protein AJ79_09736 [Helicocarpus griseus UAMH5409]
MSEYYVGPFGRILPVPEDSSSLRDSEDSSTLPRRLNNYHLPPPRKPTSLEFGSDKSLVPLESIESPGSAMNRQSSQQNNNSRHQQQDQLPSVSQLLTPVSYTSGPNSQRSFASRGNSPPSGSSSTTQRPSIGETYEQNIQTSGYASYSLVPRPRNRSSEPGDSSYGRGHYYASFHSPDQLPPLSQVGLDAASLRAHHFAQYDRNSSDAPLARYHRSQLPYLRELSNSEASPISESSSLFGEPTLRPTSSNGPNGPRLAHVVDERVIEGEGLCYIYSDGSHCPKLIDGELVNANWGITKAGKPRKRLAQACITCRDKKIKCIPNIPKCDQCQKSGRECRFENAPRGNQATKSSQQSPQPSSQKMGHHIPSAVSYSQSSVYMTNSYPTSNISTESPDEVLPNSSYLHDPGAMMYEAVGRGSDFNRPQKRRRRAPTIPIGFAGDDSKPEKDRVTVLVHAA